MRTVGLWDCGTVGLWVCGSVDGGTVGRWDGGGWTLDVGGVDRSLLLTVIFIGA